MLDLDLLKTFLCVVDERSFTRGADRVHRTQSTVSQQIGKLEASVGHPLLLRDRSGKNVLPTERGELLATYAKRLLATAQEAEDALASLASLEPVRLGVPEDFDVQRMTTVLSDYVAGAPGVRLETISGMSSDLQRELATGHLDMALIKREPASGPSLAHWPEPLVWAASASAHISPDHTEILLAAFPQGCIYRRRAIASLEKAGRRWRVVFSSHSLTGIQSAVAAGLAVSVLPRSALLPGHRVLLASDGFEPLAPTELALVAPPGPLSAAQGHLAACLRRALQVGSDA